MRAPTPQRTRYPWRWSAVFGLLATIVVALVIAAGVIPPREAEAAVFTVNSANDVDDGTCDTTHCSLHEAIDAANAGALTDSIGFNIAGPGPHTITLTGALPDITDDNLTIDGGTSEVIIVKAGGAFDGLTLETGSSNANIRNLVLDGDGTGLTAILVHDDTDGHEFSNLEIKDWTGDGIVFSDTTGDGTTTASDNNDIMDNWIHDNTADGVDLEDGTGNDVFDNQINSNGDNGVEARAETNLDITRNDIFSNTDDGVELDDTTGTTIDDNLGIFSNGDNGVDADGDSNLVITDNEIFGNLDDQIKLDDVTNVDIQRNDFVAGSDGITIDGPLSSGILIGGSAADRNRFRGIPTSVVCNDTGDDCYVELETNISVNATHNDWGSTDLTDIEDWVCHIAEGTCIGAVNYADPEAPGPSPVLGATPTPTPTNTPVATDTPTATATSTTPTATATPTGPTATPTATHTPTAGPEEAVSLLAGCQLVTPTEALEVAALRTRFSPQYNSAWRLIAATGIWQGDSPTAGSPMTGPNDLPRVERLEAFFACMPAGGGTFTRPAV